MSMLVVRSLHGKALKNIKILFLYIFANSRGGSSRREIISLVRRHHLNANQLSVALRMDYKCICHHMDVLEKNNLVGKLNIGYGGIYFITPLLAANIEVFDEILSMFPKRRQSVLTQQNYALDYKYDCNR